MGQPGWEHGRFGFFGIGHPLWSIEKATTDFSEMALLYFYFSLL
jgi:hypothetical protein